MRECATVSPERRAWLIDDAKTKLSPVLRVLLLDSLLDALLKTDSSASFDGLVQSLAGFGGEALGSVSLAMLKSRSPRQQVALAKVMVNIAPVLTAGQRVSLALELHIALARIKDEEAIEALACVLAVLRVLDDPNPN